MGRQLGTVPTTGIGKPDYTDEVSMGRVRPGLSLKYTQTLKVFGVVHSTIASVFPWVIAPLASGATQHIIDWETGLPMPYTLQQGYTMTLTQMTASFNQDCNLPIYYDTFFVGHAFTISSGTPLTRQDIVSWSTEFFDPTGASAHVIDGLLTNVGIGNLQGSISVIAILEEVGTEKLPSIKTVKCRVCGFEWEVPSITTQAKCPRCGETTIYCCFSNYKGTS